MADASSDASLDARPDAHPDAAPDAAIDAGATGRCDQPRPITMQLVNGHYTAGVSGTLFGDGPSSVPASACDDQLSAGAGADDVWTFVNPVTQPLTIQLWSPQFDGLIRLMSTACDLSTQIPDDPYHGESSIADGCADMHGADVNEHLDFTSLPAGTYYVVVDAVVAGSKGPYRLVLGTGMP